MDKYSWFPFTFPCSNMHTSMVIKCLDKLFVLTDPSGNIHWQRYLLCIKMYSGIIWKAIKFALKLNSLNDSHWESVLPDALHSIKSLLSTVTNSTPHERFFNFKRRSSFGTSLPTWLTNRGPSLLRCFARNKYNPLVDEVELMDASPNEAIIKHNDGWESMVSLRDRTTCPVSEAENTDMIKEPFEVHSGSIERVEPRPENMSATINEQSSSHSAEFDTPTSPQTKINWTVKPPQCLDLKQINKREECNINVY